eukprot:m.464307 g.464307  ORF g.464307 m.464307 type:complete len:132 (-) comp21616_c3_seq23:441-836(-)
MINVWRNIRDVPVSKTPLAACDAATISNDSIVTFEIRYKDRVGDMSRYDPNQRWYYFPNMERDEAMLLKVWDSAGKEFKTATENPSMPTVPATFSFHSAFQVPAAADAPERESIEVRTIAVFRSPAHPTKL